MDVYLTRKEIEDQVIIEFLAKERRYKEIADKVFTEFLAKEKRDKEFTDNYVKNELAKEKREKEFIANYNQNKPVQTSHSGGQISSHSSGGSRLSGGGSYSSSLDHLLEKPKQISMRMVTGMNPDGTEKYGTLRFDTIHAGISRGPFAPARESIVPKNPYLNFFK